MKTKKPKGVMKRGKATGDDTKDSVPISIFQNVTTLHGTNHFSRKKGKQLFLWTILMTANVVMTITFLMIIKEQYTNDDIVTKVIFSSLFLFPFLSEWLKSYTSPIRSRNIN